MSKVLDATCAAGVVIAGFPPLPVAGVTILSQGIGPSVGYLILDGTSAYYVAKTAPDLDTTLGAVLDALAEVRAAIQAIATGPITAAGGSAGPTWPALATELGTRVTALTAAELQLTTLKGALK